MAKEIVLSGDIGIEITAQGISSDLRSANGADVDFLINSRGGLVFAGIEIFNIIRSYTGKTRMIVTGIVASMGTYVALAADEVIAFDNTSWMIHNAMGLILGNHNDMRKRADTLEGMSNILAKAYAAKTGKALATVKALMDDETFFFGNEIEKAGFVDDIRKAGEDEAKDRSIALTDGRASVESCLVSLRDSDAANADFDRAVAYMDGMSALLGDKTPAAAPAIPAAVMGSATGANATITTPAGAGKTQEETIMTLAEFLTANPTERTAHDAALATARAEGGKAAKDEMKAVIAKVSPILGSDDYPAAVKDYGVKAIVGDGALATFDALVVMEDQRIEAAKAEAAKGETGKTGETAGDAGAGGDDAAAAAAFKAKKTDVLKQGGF